MLSALAHRFPRGWLFGGGALLGLSAAFLTPGSSGCIYHDTCIKVTSPGHDWCRNLALAKQWPVGGSFEQDGASILRPDGFAPRGCRCYNDADQQIFDDEAPECRYEEFLDELELAARQECQALVPPGYDHNCWTMSGPQASIVEDHFRQGFGSCIGNCEYGQPPAGGSCPDPSPYECATGGGTAGDGDEGCGSEGNAETGTSESGLDDTGSDTSGGMLLDSEAFVICEGRDCEIDAAFARRLYFDPSPLLAERTRLVYEAETQRHVLSSVEPGSLAHTLGLRTGDRLEAIDGMIIHDLDSALQAYARLHDATTFEVRVQRGSRWLDFHYTIVP
jgi:hypothetical protein